MKNKLLRLLALPLSAMMVCWFAWSSFAAGDVPRITKEELKKLMDTSSVTVVDVRIGKDWTASEFKIKGAVREDPKDFESWAAKYPKDKPLVLYCA